MDVKWNIAYCNVTITEYAGITYRDYYGSPATALEAQLKASEVAEKRFGVGRYIRPSVDTPAVTFASFLGMPVVVPEADELPFVDTTVPMVHDVADVDRLHIGDPKTAGLMAKRWEGWQYYTSQGHKVRFGGHGGSIVTTACEISGDNALVWLVENPEGAGRVLDFVVEANRAIEEFDNSLCGESTGGYIGDDFAGLLSPAMFREFVVPRYEHIYAGKTSRFMHSELLRAEHLRIARDLLQITSFHGAGSRNLTLREQYDIMGHDFWTQVTPQELLDLSPQAIGELIKEFANCGAAHVQLYPGRGTPDRNMEAAIAAAERECSGGSL